MREAKEIKEVLDRAEYRSLFIALVAFEKGLELTEEAFERIETAYLTFCKEDGATSLLSDEILSLVER